MISVVIPALNVGADLPRCLRSLIPAALSGIVREVVVADGGSSDSTRAVADAAGARVVEGIRGRGQQLARGAAAARGDWLLFLHADTVLAPDWEKEAMAFIASTTLERPRAAAFRFALDGRGWQARLLERLVALRCRIFALPYGDQGLLIPALLYRRLGGFRPLVLMEDVDFLRRLGRRRLVLLRSRAITSDVRYRAGHLRRALRNFAILCLYGLRVPAPLLARLYG